MTRGRAPKLLEKVGQVGLGNEQTETELYLYKIAASKVEIDAANPSKKKNFCGFFVATLDEK